MKITVQGTKITNVVVRPTHRVTTAAPNESTPTPRRSCLQETLSAQSANIDSVSGASYTSQGYEQSLQSALDQAGIK